MKKIMIFSGIFSLIGPTIGAFFKIMHWPGAAILMLFPMLVFSLVFLPLLFIFLTKKATGLKDKAMIGIGTTFGILFILSSIFKIMHWPGANIMWLCAIGLLTLVFIPLYFFSGIRNPETKVNTVIITIILMVVGGALFSLMSLKKHENYQLFEREFNHTEVDYFISAQESLEKEYDYLLKLAAGDTSFNNPINRVKDVYSICEELKSNILESEIGYKKITKDLKNKNILLSNSLWSSLFLSKKEFYQKELKKLNDILVKQDIDLMLRKTQLTKKIDNERNTVSMGSSIFWYPDFVYYNNSVIGVYVDISKIQLDAIEELIELVELKQKNKIQ